MAYGDRYPGSGSVPVWTTAEKAKLPAKTKTSPKLTEAQRQHRWKRFLATTDRTGKTTGDLLREFYKLDPANKPAGYRPQQHTPKGTKPKPRRNKTKKNRKMSHQR